MEIISILVLSLLCANPNAIVRGELCQYETNTLTCTQEIPVVLPYNVTSVFLEGLDFSEYMHEHPFHHASWRQVQSLVLTDATVDIDILARRNDYVIKKGLFKNLVNLKHLKIESMKYTQTEQDGYTGLDNLESLDLSECVRHSLTAITLGLGEIQMPKLKVLRLNGFASNTNFPTIFDKSFFHALENKPIAILDLSYTKAYEIDHEAFSYNLSHLRVFNIEHGRYIFFHLLLAMAKYPDGPTFLNIETLNASFADYPDAIFNYIHSLSYVMIIPTHSMNSFKVLSLRRIIPAGEIVDFTFQKYGDSICSAFSSKTRRKIEWMVPFCLQDTNYDNVSLEYFDFSDNGVASFGPHVIGLSRTLKILDFSMNKLGDNINAMVTKAQNHTDNVIQLYLSQNGIKNLDKKLLLVKTKLNVLDLSHNLLEHFFPFIPEHHPLQFLDLSYNRITFIDPEILSKLDNQLFAQRTLVPNGTELETLSHLSINITGNILQCTCDHRDFIEELLVSRIIIKHAMTCFHGDGVIHIDESVLPKLERICRWPKQRTLIIVFSAIFVLTFSIAMFASVRRCKTRKQNRRLKRLVDQYKNDPNKPDYPVFLSFASKDQDIVHKYIIPRLNKGLQEVLETKEVCIATGDLNFLPGFTITGEIIRCVEASRVVIFCVSGEFCESGYCKNELLVADYTRTPVILLFLEEIEVMNMSKLLQKYFFTSTRCKVTMYNDRRVLVPNWNNLCRSIVQLFDVQDS